MDTQWWTQPAREIARSVRAELVSPVEVAESFLARIADADAGFGAFQEVRPELVRAEADSLARRADIATLPLAGVPVAVKDNFNVTGYATRQGSAATSPRPAQHDDELVRRLRAAGAIVVGKTRMPELAAWAMTESLAFGGTRNPWNASLNAGGSTGGGAAAVASGMAALAIGTDGGGSLRIPAAYCGVVGFKPAAGALPLLGDAEQHWLGLTASGPIARDVEDTALAFAVMRGEQPPALQPISCCVAVSLRSPTPLGGPGRWARQSVLRAAEALRSAGHDVNRADPAYPMLLIPQWCGYWYAGVADDARGLRREALEPRTRTMVAKGERLARRSRPTDAARHAWRRTATRFFDQHDVLVTPVAAQPAPRMGALERTGFTRTYLASARGVPFTQAWNMSGFPAISIPFGLDDEGLPYAVQLATSPGREALLLAVAAQLEAVHGALHAWRNERGHAIAMVMK